MIGEQARCLLDSSGEQFAGDLVVKARGRTIKSSITHPHGSRAWPVRVTSSSRQRQDHPNHLYLSLYHKRFYIESRFSLTLSRLSASCNCRSRPACLVGFGTLPHLLFPHAQCHLIDFYSLGRFSTQHSHHGPVSYQDFSRLKRSLCYTSMD